MADVVGMDWDEFRDFFRVEWKPGQHIGLIGPTESGKSTFVGGIVDLRRYFLVADPKGGDETLAALNLRRLTSWPGERNMTRILDDDERHNRPSRFVLGPIVNRGDDLPKLRKAIADGLDGAFDMGGWTVYVDEAQITADRRMMNLSGKLDKLLVAARSKGVSVILSMQQPKWVTSAALTQPSWLVVGYTRDTDTTNRLAELMGRPKAEIRGATKGLEEHCWLVVGRNPRKPLIVTKPRRIAPKRAAS
jgi:hypothetical protein